MHETTVSTAANPEETALPRRDWILLPLIAVATITFMMAVSEAAARVVWPEQEDSCLVRGGPNGLRFLPNCKSRAKEPETPWVEYSYNSCGYHTLEPCGPKPVGTIRIAVLGSSYSHGYLVPYDAAFTTLAGKMLTDECRRHVEFQNLGVNGYPLIGTYSRTEEALALKPDILLLVISPPDIHELNMFDPDASPASRAQSAADKSKKNGASWIRILNLIKSSRAFMMLQHFMYQNPTTAADIQLLHGDELDYERPPFSPLWRQRFSNFDTMLRAMSDKARAASAPMVLLVGPSVSQVALVNTPPRNGIDPEAFPAEIARIASTYGITVINPLPGFKGQRDPMKMFYVVSGHPGSGGHRVIADAVNKALLSGNFPAFAGCSQR